MKATQAHVPRKKPKLGQHFLIDPAAAMQIVEALGDLSQSTVLEIGPGRGALTSLLARRARRVIAVETDRVLAAQLRMKFSLTPNLEIIEGDILAVDFHTLFGPKPGSMRPGLEETVEPVRVIGNLPYFLTSDILLRLFEYRKYFETIVLMVQKEVADRLAAEPGSRDYGLLTVTAQLFASVERLFTLSPGAFSPPPQVYSSILRLRIAPKAQSLGVDSQEFLDFCKLAFAQKRKTLFNNLRRRHEDIEIKEILRSAGVREDVRAEALSLHKLAEIYKLWHTSPRL